MPDEVEAAVHAATRDKAVKVIVLRGAGRAFCAGYNFGKGFHHWDDLINTNGEWDAGKDFAFATTPALSPHQKFMSLWRSSKPVIAQVHGWCVGGGSDYALCCDLVIASEDARRCRLRSLRRRSPKPRRSLRPFRSRSCLRRR